VTKDTFRCVDGICVPKVDALSDLNTIESVLSTLEDTLSLPPNTLKVIP